MYSGSDLRENSAIQMLVSYNNLWPVCVSKYELFGESPQYGVNGISVICVHPHSMTFVEWQAEDSVGIALVSFLYPNIESMILSAFLLYQVGPKQKRIVATKTGSTASFSSTVDPASLGSCRVCLQSPMQPSSAFFAAVTYFFCIFVYFAFFESLAMNI